MSKKRNLPEGDVVTLELPPSVVRHISAERFVREIDAASALVEPHIVPVTSAGVRVGGTVYYAMPFVAGASLRERLDQDEPLLVRESVTVMRGLADALAYAHAQNVVHGNLGPDKIVLSFGTPLVLEFGVARALELARQPTSSISAFGGVPAYMAPEQFSATGMGAPADVYAWGIIAYEMLSGSHPFAGRTSADQLIAAHHSEVPVHLFLKTNDLPAPLIDLVMKCLEKHPLERPTALGLASALQDMQTRGEIHSDDSDSAASWGWRRTAVSVALCALAGVAFFRMPAIVERARELISPSSPVVPGLPIATVAVLPFVNEGGSFDEYLSAGITEELAHALSRLPGIHLIGRATTSSYKGVLTDPVEIGKALDVGGVVTGRIKRADGKLTVQVRLFNVSSGAEAWSAIYDRTPSDLLAVQTEFTRSLAAALSPSVTDGNLRRLVDVSRGTIDAAAYDFYLQGRAALRLGGAVNLQQAIVLFQRSETVDARFARAVAATSRSYLALGKDFSATRDTMTTLAFRAANRAVSLDPTSADAHWTLGDALAGSLRFAEAGEHYGFALKQLGGDPAIHASVARNLLATGRVEEALDQARQAARLDPRSLDAADLVSLALIDARRFGEAARQSRLVVAIDSTHYSAARNLARATVYLGQPDSALVALATSYQRDPGLPGIRATLLMAFAAAGRAGDAQRVRDEMLSSGTLLSDYDDLMISLASGNKPLAIAALDRSLKRGRDVTEISESLGCDPLFDPLKNDPSYLAILVRLGIAPCPAATPWPIAVPLAPVAQTP